MSTRRQVIEDTQIEANQIWGPNKQIEIVTQLGRILIFVPGRPLENTTLCDLPKEAVLATFWNTFETVDHPPFRAPRFH